MCANGGACSRLKAVDDCMHTDIRVMLTNLCLELSFCYCGKHSGPVLLHVPTGNNCCLADCHHKFIQFVSSLLSMLPGNTAGVSYCAAIGRKNVYI